MSDTGALPAGRSGAIEAAAVRPTWNGRRVRSWALAGGITLGAIGGAVVLGTVDVGSRSSDRLGSADVGRPAVPTGDAYFAVPAAPSDVTMEVSDDGALMVAWKPSQDAVSYQVERLDEPGDQVVEVTESMVTLVVAPGERPCVSIAAVGRGGQRSQSSAAVCVRD